MSFYQGCRTLPRQFGLVLSSAMQAPDLPFSDVLTEDDIKDAFDEEDAWFAEEEDDIYTPQVTLWAFLSQVLHKGTNQTCLGAVARVIVLLTTLGREPCLKNSGAYCKARAKFPEVASGSVDNMDGLVAHDLIVGYCKGSQSLSRRATYRRTDPCLLKYASLV
jgi:hypothetical protein